MFRVPCLTCRDTHTTLGILRILPSIRKGRYHGAPGLAGKCLVCLPASQVKQACERKRHGKRVSERIVQSPPSTLSILKQAPLSLSAGDNSASSQGVRPAYRPSSLSTCVGNQILQGNAASARPPPSESGGRKTGRHQEKRWKRDGRDIDGRLFSIAAGRMKVTLASGWHANDATTQTAVSMRDHTLHFSLALLHINSH
ncbi:hypothetical protein LZ31DRAFT_10702 [Colletotrichum somersetense]|nr:hypothetical protein LZ31DRAFT_10702 [Colletotrichum somersetense]